MLWIGIVWECSGECSLSPAPFTSISIHSTVRDINLHIIPVLLNLKIRSGFSIIEYYIPWPIVHDEKCNAVLCLSLNFTFSHSFRLLLFVFWIPRTLYHTHTYTRDFFSRLMLSKVCITQKTVGHFLAADGKLCFHVLAGCSRKFNKTTIHCYGSKYMKFAYNWGQFLVNDAGLRLHSPELSHTSPIHSLSTE